MIRKCVVCGKYKNTCEFGLEPAGASGYVRWKHVCIWCERQRDIKEARLEADRQNRDFLRANT